MTPAMLELILALYRHALAPSTANQDAVRAAGRAVEAEAAKAKNT